MSVLARIFEIKRGVVEAARARRSINDIQSIANEADPCRGFKAALELATPQIALIGEDKQASPSKGLIRTDFDAAKIAAAYERTGARALSRLTDAPHCQGGAEHSQRARR